MRSNGLYKDLDIIKDDVKDIKSSLTASVDRLTSAVTNLSDKVELFTKLQERSVPLIMVKWGVVILVLTIVGVQGADWFIEHKLMR